jgi:hypothetical protein
VGRGGQLFFFGGFMFLLLRADDELGAIDGTEVDFQAAG